jgi:hypothetical protein
MTIVYKIMLSGEGDWLKDLGNDTWKATFKIDEATSFDSHGAAMAYINENEIKFIWPQVNVQSVGV